MRMLGQAVEGLRMVDGGDARHGAGEARAPSTPLAVLALVTSIVYAAMAYFAAAVWVWLAVSLWFLFVLVAIFAHADPPSRKYIAGTLRKSTFTQIYTTLAKRSVAGLWARLCDPVADDAPALRMFRAALTWRLYDRALLIAVAYPILLPVLWWLVTGRDATLGPTLLVEGTGFRQVWPQRAVSLGACFILATGLVARRLTAASQRMIVRRAAGWLLLVAAALAVSAVVSAEVGLIAVLALALAAALVLAGPVSGAAAIGGALVVAVTIAFVGRNEFSLALFAGLYTLAIGGVFVFGGAAGGKAFAARIVAIAVGLVVVFAGLLAFAPEAASIMISRTVEAQVAIIEAAIEVVGPIITTALVAVAVVAAAVIAATVVAAPVKYLDERGHPRRVRIALTLVLPVVWIAVVRLRDVSEFDASGQFFVLFFGVFPLINALFDVVSYAVTLALIRRGVLARLPVFYGLADLGIAFILLLGLGAALTLTLVGLNALTGVNALLDFLFIDITRLFDGIRTDGHAYWWLYAMIFSTIVPTALHGLLSLFGLQGLTPRPFRRRVAGWIDSAPATATPWKAVAGPFALGAIWAVPLIAIAAALVGLWYWVDDAAKAFGLLYLTGLESLAQWVGTL